MTRESMLKRLDEIEESLMATGVATTDADPSSELQVVAALLRKIGQQQMRNAQDQELLVFELRETARENRLHNAELQARAKGDRLRLLEWVDALDDAMVLARQNGDPRLISWFERVLGKGIQTLAEIGCAELPGVGRPFDEASDEVLDTVIRGSARPYEVVEVLRRGFIWNGTVLRRTQVIVAMEMTQ